MRGVDGCVGLLLLFGFYVLGGMGGIRCAGAMRDGWCVSARSFCAARSACGVGWDWGRVGSDSKGGCTAISIKLDDAA